MNKYEVRRRRWPFRKPLKRPWELIRVSDMKPVGFYVTPEAAEMAKADAEAASAGPRNRAERRALGARLH